MENHLALPPPGICCAMGEQQVLMANIKLSRQKVAKNGNRKNANRLCDKRLAFRAVPRAGLFAAS